MKSVKVYLYVSAPPEPNDPQYVCVSHMKIRWGRHRQTHIYPIAQLGALKFAPTSTVSPSKTTAARDAEWTSTSSASDRGGDRCSWLLWGSTSSARNVDCVRGVNMTFLAARSAGCARTMDTGHRIVQRRVRRIETRGTENRRGEGGWQAFSKLRKREVKIYWHTHTTRSHTLIQIPLCAMKTCLQTFMCECVEDLNKAICNEDMLANPYVWVCGSFE